MGSGKFITFEGGEGTGKSTQARLLGETLRIRGINIVLTREPGGTPGAEQIRNVLLDGNYGPWKPLSEVLLHFAARREHISQMIQPALKAGDWVISDRFADSTTAYQGYGKDVGVEAIAAIYGVVLGDLKPDLTLILDLPVPIGLKRVMSRRRELDRYEQLDASFHERVREGYQAIAKQDPERCILVDGSGSEGETQKTILEIVDKHLLSMNTDVTS